MQIGSNGLSLTPLENASQTNSPTKDKDLGSLSPGSLTSAALVPLNGGGAAAGAVAKMLHNCGICGKGFTEKHHMTRHERTVHECKKEYHCEVRAITKYIVI